MGADWLQAARRAADATAAMLDARPSTAERVQETGQRGGQDGRLELVGIESADPRYLRERADALAETAGRLRALGAIAVTLCQVASARLDGMLTLRGCRAVDCAAGQLIVREAGGYIA